MACGVPTIATNVGDVAYIIADQGIIIPPKNPKALIEAIESIMQNTPSQERIRDRIVSHFDVPQMVDKTIQALTEAL